MAVVVKDLKLARPIGNQSVDTGFRVVQILCILKPRGTPNVFPYDIVMVCFHIVESGPLSIVRACFGNVPLPLAYEFE